MRHLVLFVIDLKTRGVHVAGITRPADGAWMAQIARNLTDAVGGPLRGIGHLIVDRDPLYTAHFKHLLAEEFPGSKIVVGDPFDIVADAAPRVRSGHAQRTQLAQAAHGSWPASASAESAGPSVA
ncbi:MAG: hypothetical protein ABTD50_20570 [Polyangiaceae bacterium]